MSDDDKIGDQHAMREPAWLTAKADQPVALMIETTGSNFPEGALVTTPLTEPTPGQPFEVWDRSCDNCGRYVEDGELLWSGSVFRTAPSGHRIVVSFGACKECKEA